jgi:hypothetical protein
VAKEFAELKDLAWDSLQIVFPCTVAENAPEFCEEMVVVVQATSEADAREVGMRYGSENRTTYLNEVGETVSWTFRQVSQVERLSGGPAASGWEVWSRLVDYP